MIEGQPSVGGGPIGREASQKRCGRRCAFRGHIGGCFHVYKFVKEVRLV